MSEDSRTHTGSALGNVGSYIATPIGMSLGAIVGHSLGYPEAGTALGGLIGTATGGFTGSYINSGLSLLKLHLPARWRLLRLLKRKLTSDFVHSYLDEDKELRRAAKDSHDLLADAQVTKHNDPNFDSSLLERVPTQPLDRATRSHYETQLWQREPIRVNCAALFPAALAVLLNLRNRLKSQVDIQIDYNDINSHDQFERVTSETNFDFIVAAEVPFSIVTSGLSGGAMEPEPLSHYRRLLPCNVEWQYAFRRKGNRPSKTIHVYQASSAKLQFQVGVGRGEYRFEERKILHGKEMAFYADKHTLDPSECILVWEPLADLFHDNPDFERLKIERFKVWISLFCRDAWLEEASEARRKAFCQLFIDEWRLLRQPLSDYQAAYNVLVDQPDFVRKFAQSAGLEKDMRYSLDLFSAA